MDLFPVEIWQLIVDKTDLATKVKLSRVSIFLYNRLEVYENLDGNITLRMLILSTNRRGAKKK